MFTKETLIYLFLGLLIASTGSGSVTLDNSLQLPTDIFTGFFPCVPGSVNMSTQEDAQNCDLFVYAAVQLALDRVEEELKREQRRLHLSSVVTHPRSKGTKDTDINQVKGLASFISICYARLVVYQLRSPKCAEFLPNYHI